MCVVVVDCYDNGDVDFDDLCVKVGEYVEWLLVLMIIYLFIYGVYEYDIVEICVVVYDVGGQVYVDGVNFNVLVGLVWLGKFGGDVSYFNLYKIFCILYGGGGLGVGLVVVWVYLVLFLLGYFFVFELFKGYLVLLVLYGLVLIFLIIWVYIWMMGVEGLWVVLLIVIMLVNYIVCCFDEYYLVLYIGENGMVVYECILDLCGIIKLIGIIVDDVVKWLVDYGFYVLMMSFLVVGMFMVEFIESESLVEVDVFCEVMIGICVEIDKVGVGEWFVDDNLLCGVLYIVQCLLVFDWDYLYMWEQVVYLFGIVF